MARSRRRRSVVTVLGTRPEIIKCSPLIPLFDGVFEHTVIHTGQHYDFMMDSVFFKDLELRLPNYNLAVGSGSPAIQLARMLERLDCILQALRPDWVFVQGDTNSTLAGALAAVKLDVPVAHLEAGCRSFNRAMPEEINRILVDHTSTLCFAPDEFAARNLRVESINPETIAIVGSTGVDACLRAVSLGEPGSLPRELALEPGTFLLATVHRAENTTPERLHEILLALDELGRECPVIFPLHPRTKRVLDRLDRPHNVQFYEPFGYRTMMHLLQKARALLTDSGGLQEESAVIGTPTFILRNETEWMAFVEAGRHRLVGNDRTTIVEGVRSALDGGAIEAQMHHPIGSDRAGASARVLKIMRTFTTASEGREQWSLPTRKS
jgi:UDP-N-acetylglucosamine 2-epimerase